MNKHFKIDPLPSPQPLQQSSSGAALEEAVAGATAGIAKMSGVRDSAVKAVLDAAEAEYRRRRVTDALRDQFRRYVERMPDLHSSAFALAIYIASIAEVGASGALELKGFTLVGMGKATRTSDETVVKYLRDDKVLGLEARKLIEVLTAARGGHQQWHIRLILGAGDADLPELGADAAEFRAAIAESSGFPGS